METLGVLGADNHGEGIFEAERFGDFELKSLGVELLDAAVDGVGIALRGFVEDGREGRTGVFDVEIEVSCEKSFVDEERAAEIGFADNGDAGASFDVLGEELGENDLLGEKLGADSNFGSGRMAGEKKGRDEEEESEAAHEEASFSRAQRKGKDKRMKRRIEKRKINTEFTEISTQRTQRRCSSKS
jgi:hypothetical protein